MTARGAAVAELIRAALAAVDQLDPVERSAIYAALVADLRSRRPAAVSLMTLGAPTEPIRDRRGSGGGR
jgi:acyl-CoA reductase-like NAD-dependent aldehyde dehydrogenase